DDHGLDFVGEDSAVAEELPQLERRIRAAEERRERLVGDPRQRLLGDVADLPVGILDEQRQDGDLLVGARRQRPLGGLHAHVPRHVAALEEIQERSRTDHRGRNSLKLLGVTRVVTTWPALPSGLAADPFSVIEIAEASPAVSTISRLTAIV